MMEMVCDIGGLKMSANLITLIRLVLVFVAVALFNLNFYANAAKAAPVEVDFLSG